MKRLSVLIWFLLYSLAQAQAVEVKSGDHTGFTRLVVELPKSAGWQLGRTSEGYALRITDETLQFDVTGVFDDIQRNRLAAIWTDPASGALRLGVACACHAIAFEFRPGIIVIDLRDGPPPNGSSFELAIDGSDASNLTQRTPPRPRTRPPSNAAKQDSVMPTGQNYDWLTNSEPSNDQQTSPEPKVTLPFSVEYTDVTPLKEALLRELSQGAAQGLVQLEQRNLTAGRKSDSRPLGPRANIHLGEVPGFAATTRRNPKQTLIKDGASCISNDRLDVGSWANNQSVPSQLAENHANLVGEFDRPNADSVIRFVKLLINLGFGAEARQLLAEMPVDHDDFSLWKSMAKLVDGAFDIDGPFTEMQTCDTAAALWAVLATPQLTKGQKLNSGAVLRGFSALPTQLRRHLGPGLAAKFLAVGELETSQALSNSALRGVTESEASLSVMEANLEVAAGSPTAAAVNLQPAMADAGAATADVLIALVDAKIAAEEPIGHDTVLALAAYLYEQKGSSLEPELQKAHILALGSSGDFDQAFALLPKAPEAEGDLWVLLSKSGSDSATITHAVLPASANLPLLSTQQRREFARHLLNLGLPDAALVWIGQPDTNAAIQDRLLAAEAYLSNGEPSNSLKFLAGVEDNTAAGIRAQAFWQLNQMAEAADAWAEAGNTEAEQRAQSWAQNWEALSTREASPWRAAATIIAGGAPSVVPNSPGPLAMASALVAESATVRATLTDLLATISGPPRGN